MKCIGLLEPQDPVSGGPTKINACAFEVSRSRQDLDLLGRNKELARNDMNIGPKMIGVS